MVRYNQALDFVISINPNYGHNTMEILNMNQDVEGVYKAFGAETLEEKKEIIKAYHNWEWTFPKGLVDKTSKEMRKRRLKTKIEELQEAYDKLDEE